MIFKKKGACPHCFQSIDQIAAFCPFCREFKDESIEDAGYKTKKCPNCQKRVKRDARICKYCHKWFRGKDASKLIYGTVIMIAVVFITGTIFLTYIFAKKLGNNFGCEFDNLKLENGMVFQITDAPGKDNKIVVKKEKECRILLNGEDGQSFEVNPIIRQALYDKLSNKPGKKINFDLPINSNPENISIGIDLRAKIVSNWAEKMNNILKRLSPGGKVLVTIFGGNQLGPKYKTIEIKYLPQQIIVSGNIYSKQNIFEVFVNDFYSNSKEDNDIFESNDIGKIKNRIIDFYNQNKDKPELNRSNYLYEVLDYLIENKEDPAIFIIFSDGIFENRKRGAYSFDQTNLNIYLKRYNQRQFEIEDALRRQKEAQTEEERSVIVIPSSLPSFDSYFDSLRIKTKKLGACFYLSEIENSSIELNDFRSKLYKDLKCNY